MKSMTGFGSADKQGSRGKIRVEVRSYNHRYLDVKLRLPKPLLSFESRIYMWARKRLVRGRVDFTLRWEESVIGVVPLQFNPAVVEYYLDLDKRLREDYGVPGALDVPTLLGLRDTVSAVEEQSDVEEEWPTVSDALEGAVKKMEEMQSQEGRTLQQDLLGRIEFLAGQRNKIEVVAKDISGQCREKLEKRLASLVTPGQLDPQRLAQEVVLLTDKMDVTEELVRLASHLEACRTSLDQGTVTGKRLDFLAQEINREINTIGSKSSHTEITHRVVDMKTELEKVREQAQNLQ